MNRPPLCVILIAPRNPLNIGAAARAMSNFGFTDLRLVNPYEVAYQEARSAVNAGYILENAREFATVAEAIADCSLVVGSTSIGHRELQHPLRRLEYAGRLLREHLATAPAALLFGSEKFGLSNEDMSYCHWLTRIPTREEHGSMNLGQAVSICLYELIRDPEAVDTMPVAKKQATGDDLDRITAILLQTLNKSGYINARVAGSTEMKIRRLIRRLDLPAHDAEVWLGMFRQILWKIEQCYPDAE